MRGYPGGYRGASGFPEVLQAQREEESLPPFPSPQSLGRARHQGGGGVPGSGPKVQPGGWGGPTGAGHSAWCYKRQPGHRGNELPARLSSKTLATGTPCSGSAPSSTAAMVSMLAAAWCSVALALLMILHEGELPCTASPAAAVPGSSRWYLP